MVRNSIVLSICALLFPIGGSLSRAQESLPQSRLEAVDHAAAWQRVPQEMPPLPVWARILVAPLPKATAALLELDYRHRHQNPLGAVWAGKLRWTAADAMGCQYARRYAEADLRRAGVSDEELEQLAAARDTLAEDEREVLALARQLTLAGHEVSDDQIARLVEWLGPEQVVGIVHTVAFANFENRLFLALGVEVEPDGPLPPVACHADAKQQAEIAVPARRSWEELSTDATSSLRALRADWGARDFVALEEALEQQRQRSPRIPLPDPQRLAGLEPNVRERAEKVVWSNVSLGWQPLLTGGWFHLMQTFRDEAKLDRVFSNSMFWVVTRSNECFY